MSFKRFLLVIVLFAAAAFLAAGRAFALDVPPLAAPVNDHASVLAPEVKNRLNAELLALQQETGAQIAVLTIPSLEGEVLEDYSLRVASTWGLGEKDKNNGVLLFVAIKDRKLRIEVGQGLEGTLTDALSSRIIRQEIAPAFKLGDYAAGVENGIAAMMRVVRSGEFAPSEAALAFAQRIKDREDRNFYSGLGLVFANVLLGIGAYLTKRRELLAAKGNEKALDEIENRHALALCLMGAVLAIAALVFFAYEPGDSFLWLGVLAFCGLLLGPILVYIPILALSPSKPPPSSSRDSDDDDSGYGSSSSSSSGGSSYSGGGGRFGGGGASGSW